MLRGERACGSEREWEGGAQRGRAVEPLYLKLALSPAACPLAYCALRVRRRITIMEEELSGMGGERTCTGPCARMQVVQRGPCDERRRYMARCSRSHCFTRRLYPVAVRRLRAQPVIRSVRRPGSGQGTRGLCLRPHGMQGQVLDPAASVRMPAASGTRRSRRDVTDRTESCMVAPCTARCPLRLVRVSCMCHV